MPRWTLPTPPFVNAECHHRARQGKARVSKTNQAELHLGRGLCDTCTITVRRCIHSCNRRQSHLVEWLDMHIALMDSPIECGCRDTHTRILNIGTFQSEVASTQCSKVEKGTKGPFSFGFSNSKKHTPPLRQWHKSSKAVGQICLNYLWRKEQRLVPIFKNFPGVQKCF